MTADALDQPWDAIVVGTGIGGGTLGRRLAERGLRVLFLEKGRAGFRAEETRIELGLADPTARALRGAWPEALLVDQDGVRREVLAPIGSGVGGSSVFYAATLERPEPRDLDAWPLSWAALRPRLEEAERLFHVEGEPDPLSDDPAPPLRAPPPHGPADAAIRARLLANGMHPYRLHAAIRRLPGCRECFGRKCPLPCKMDGRSAGVEPALETGRAALLAEAEVTGLILAGPRVEGVELRLGGELRRVLAPRVVLAAGALSTPRLLMAAGLGGEAVGRHLMLHLNETFAVFPRVRDPEPSKALGMRDLMLVGGRRGGMVQALGVDAREPEILHHLRGRLEAMPGGRSRLAREGARLPAAMATRMMGTAKLFVGLLEDLPDPANRVASDPGRPGRIVATYRVGPELSERRALFRRAIRRAFRGLAPVFVHGAPDPNWGHPCGTARMGADPATSVTDAWGRVHGAEGLWVADAGLFPTSMGVNPSLTVAALALRVAEGIVEGVAR